MSTEVRLGQNSLRLLYYRYKDSPYFALLLVVVIIFVCMILFFQVVLPRVQDWFSIRDEIVRTRERIDTVNQNISFMNNIDKSLLNNQVTVATSALPTEKDFSTMIAALSYAAAQSGVSLDDYNFQIGNIASTEGKLNDTVYKNISSVKMSISVRGDVDGIEAFLTDIGEQLPLSEVTAVEADNNITSILIEFYQKKFPIIIFQDDVPFSQISDAHLSLLRTMASWQPVVNQEQQEVSSSSGSNIPLF